MKRSNKPIFWALFGAGGMLSALIGPMLIFITGIAIPAGLMFSPDAMNYDAMRAFVTHPAGKIALVAVISLFLFHGFHRFYHTLHDFGVPIGGGIKALCHGLAALGTLIAIALVVAIGC